MAELFRIVLHKGDTSQIRNYFLKGRIRAMKQGQMKATHLETLAWKLREKHHQKENSAQAIR